jgi:hypothetical protein
MEHATLRDLLVIADALDRAPDSFMVRRTIRRLEARQVGVAEAAARLRTWDRSLGLAPAAEIDDRSAARALAIARLLDR